MIGGSDKYMATCRKCFFANVTIPASPRIPMKNIETVENGENQEPAHKRALFEVEKNSIAVTLNWFWNLILHTLSAYKTTYLLILTMLVQNYFLPLHLSERFMSSYSHRGLFAFSKIPNP